MNPLNVHELNCEFDLVENNENVLKHLSAQCVELYNNRLTDPIYEKSKKESSDFQKLTAKLLEHENISLDPGDDISKDKIEIDYEKRMNIYADKKLVNLLVLNTENITCVDRFNNHVRLPDDTHCTIKANITLYNSISLGCDNRTIVDEYFDCLTAEKEMQLLRFSET